MNIKDAAYDMTYLQDNTLTERGWTTVFVILILMERHFLTKLGGPAPNPGTSGYKASVI